MKMFQYLTADNDFSQGEIWVCEVCRKQNCEKILVGNWRLIDKCDYEDFDCERCTARPSRTAGLALEG